MKNTVIMIKATLRRNINRVHAEGRYKFLISEKFA